MEELEEKLVHLQASADQAALIKREKEIELETLQRYFKSTEVDLHRQVVIQTVLLTLHKKLLRCFHLNGSPL